MTASVISRTMPLSLLRAGQLFALALQFALVSPVSGDVLGNCQAGEHRPALVTNGDDPELADLVVELELEIAGLALEDGAESGFESVDELRGNVFVNRIALQVRS